MTNSQTINISDIQILNRERIDYGDVTDLAESIKQNGLIEPIILTGDSSPRLIAGGRRLRALTSIGATVLYHGTTGVVDQPGYLLRAECTEEQLKLLEYEENSRRKDYTWQEQCLSIYRIHLLKSRNAATAGDSWTMRETGRLMGVSLGKVGYAAIISRKLIAGDKRIQEAETFNQALRVLQQDEIDALNKRLAEFTSSVEVLPSALLTNLNSDLQSNSESLINIEKEQARQRYESNPNNTIPFESYWETKQKLSPEYQDKLNAIRNTVNLSSTIICGDCIDYLKGLPEEVFDHCITDPPYGIDMDYLNQQNPHGGFVNIERVEDEHDVEENENLFVQMVPAIFRVLKPNSFFIFWCDWWQSRNLADLCLKVGFKVQRWPLIWYKTHACINQCAQYNFTKNTEIALVCRKGNATLTEPAASSVIIASSDSARKEFAHPFAKPTELTEFIMNYVTIHGQLILEPFAGIGSITLPLLRNGRRVVSIEKNEKHYNQLLENVKQHYLSLNPGSVFV